MWVEVFKAGTHTDSNGSTESYDADKLDKIAFRYNEMIAEDESNMAPVVKGHPKDNEPAYGWVERLARRGTKLMAQLKNLAPEFIAEIKSGRFKKISIALYKDLMLRHIGFLGAISPAVKGLHPPTFSDDMEYDEYENDSDNNLVSKSLNELFDNEELQEILKRLENENSQYKAKLDLIEKESRLMEFRQFTNSLIENAEGAIITPAQADSLIDILEMAHQTDAVRIGDFRVESGEYSEERCLVNKVKEFISGLKPVLNLSEFAVSDVSSDRTGRSDKTGSDRIDETDYSQKNVSSERLELHEKAKELRRGKPGLSYEEAVCIAARQL